MVSIVFHYRPHRRTGGVSGSIFVRIIHRRRTINITLPYKVSRSEWDEKQKKLNPAQASGNRLAYLLRVNGALEETRRHLQEIIYALSEKGEFTTLDVATAYRCRQDGLTAVVALLASEMKDAGCYRTARAYQTALNGLLSFAGKRELQATDITADLLKRFEVFLKKSQKSPNTISFYMRNLRAIYNKACHRGIFPYQAVSPFKDVYTGVPVTVKRALNITEMRNMERLLSRSYTLPAGLADALHYFLFAFHAQGMCYVDMAYLQKASLKGDVLVYKRKKTGQEIRVPVTRELRRHLDYFSNRVKHSPYLFPVICDSQRPAYVQYCNGLGLQNRRLKEIQRLLGLVRPLSMHIARHSWATLARHAHVADEVISEGLGHRSLATTRIYLDGFNMQVLLNASCKVSRSVCPVRM